MSQDILLSGLADLARHPALLSQVRVAKKVEGRSPRTLEWYCDSVENLKRFCDRNSVPFDLENLTPYCIRAWVSDMQDRGLSENTINTHFRSLRSIINWGKTEGIIAKTPFENIKAPKVAKRLIPLFQPEHIRALLTLPLAKALLAVAPYAATEDVRPVLKAVCLTPGDTIEVAAANGFRLAWETVPGKLSGDKPIVIPSGTVEVMAHLWKRAASPDLSAVSDPAGLARAKRLMRLNRSDSKLQFSFGEVIVVAQHLQGSFPYYRQLIPTNGSATVTIAGDEMERALRQLALAAKNGSGIVRLRWEDEQLVLSAKSEKFETSVPLPATCSGPGNVAVNIKYLLEYCSGRPGRITLSWTAPSSPVLFSYRDHPTVVMMPMFVKWDDEHQASGANLDEGTPEKPAGNHVGQSEAEGAETRSQEKLKRSQGTGKRPVLESQAILNGSRSGSAGELALLRCEKPGSCPKP